MRKVFKRFFDFFVCVCDNLGQQLWIKLIRLFAFVMELAMINCMK